MLFLRLSLISSKFFNRPSESNNSSHSSLWIRSNLPISFSINLSIFSKTLEWFARADSANGNCGSLGSVSLSFKCVIYFKKNVCKQSQKSCKYFGNSFPWISFGISNPSWICGGVYG